MQSPLARPRSANSGQSSVPRNAVTPTHFHDSSASTIIEPDTPPQAHTPMTHTIQSLVLLLVVVAVVGIVARRLKIPPAILLVLTGVVLALVPGLPAVRLAPELVLLLVLPPIIYSSAV